MVAVGDLIQLSNAGGWQPWSPTHTNLTIGSGTVSARYARVGNTIHYEWNFTFGAGSAVGSSPTFTLPVAPAFSAAEHAIGLGYCMDTGVAPYFAIGSFTGGSTVAIRVINAAGTYAAPAGVTATIPFTWASTDTMTISGTYEAA